MNPVEQGYDDQRFQNVVDDNFHCPICMNVLKEPVQCRRNEHYYCTPCITKHLKETSQTCPMCMEVLTVETLKEPSRMVSNYLSPLKINCDFASRGCGQVVELGLLKTHVKNCEFSPVVACSIDGCLMMVNKRDVQHHETQVCEFRKLKCDDCGEEVQYKKYKTHGCVLSKEMDKMKMNQAEIKDQLGAQENMMKEMRGMMDEMKDEIKKLTKQVTVGLPREDIVAGSFFEGQRPPMFPPQAVVRARFPSHNVRGQPGYPQMQLMNWAGIQSANTRPMGHSQQQSRVAGAGMTMPSQRGVGAVQSRRNKHRRAPVNQPGAGPQAAANTSSSPQYYYGEGQDILNPTALAQASASDQKQMLGERLFPLIQQTHPDLAGKITGMLLEIDNSELLHLLEFRDALSAKVEEAVSVIHAHQAREAPQEAAKK